MFQFGEHFLPTRTMFATVQGLRGDPATKGMLGKTKSTNVTPDEVHMATQGHLLRFLKQLGMRGRARKFDSEGVCGKQVLVLTCDFERLLVNADRMFPGATLSKWRRTQRRKLTQPDRLLEILTDPETLQDISGDEIAKRMGVEKWGAPSTNVMTAQIRDRVLPNLGWSYVPQRGRGGGPRFIKTETGVLKLAGYRRPE